MGQRWNRLPGSRREPPGLERTVLRKLPLLALWGTAVAVLPALFARVAWGASTSPEVYRAVHMADIWALGSVTLFWAALLTVGIFCVVVLVMKGPAYIADRYDLPDSDRPDSDRPD